MSLGGHLQRTFDDSRMRRYLGGCPSIVHPHLWAVEHVRHALEAGELRGGSAADLLRDSAEEAFAIDLKRLLIAADPIGMPEKKSLIEEHFRACGLGKLELNRIGADGGEAVLSVSPFDECWISAYGKPSSPVNLMTEGYLAAAFAAAMGLFLRSFAARETESLAMGAAASRFVITRRA